MSDKTPESPSSSPEQNTDQDIESLLPLQMEIPDDEWRVDTQGEELSPEAYYHLKTGLTYFKEKKLHEAEESVVKAIDLHPPLSPIYNAFAVLKIAQRAIGTLKQSVYKALTLNPEFMDEFVMDGIKLLSEEKYSEAEEQFKKAIALNPENTDARFRLGFTYVTQNKYDDAINSFEELIQIDPSNINAFFMLGLSYSERKDFYPSIANFQQALRIAPAFIEARLSLADAYHHMGKYLISLEELNILEGYIPDEDTTYLHRGMILLELEQFEEAIPYFEKVLELKPKVVEAQELLIGLYENLGHKEKALAQVQTALQYAPDHENFLKALERLSPDSEKE